MTMLRKVVLLVWSDAGPAVKLRIAAVLTLVLAASILTALGPVALKGVVDGFAGPVNTWARSPAMLIGLYVLSQWLARSVGEVRVLIYARAERRMFRSLSERLFAHLMRLPLRFHLDRHTGAVSQTLDNGLQGYQMILHHLVFTFLPVAAELGTIIVVVMHLGQPVFLILFCAALVCYAAAFAFATATIAGAAESASGAYVNSNAAILDNLLCVETVKYFTAEAVVQERVSSALARVEKEWVGFYRRYALNGVAVATIFALFLGTTSLYATRQVQTGRMTVGDFVLVNAYMLQVVRPVEMLGYAMQGLSQGIAMLKKMLELFQVTAETSAADDVLPITGRGELEFQNVSLSYGPRRPVLKDVSFRIPAGKTLGIVGASGSGKTTIVRLLVRLFEPDGGRVLLDGTPISALPLSRLRQAVAVVPQDAVLFNDTIGYNIGFGKARATPAEIEEAAKLAHLHDFILGLSDRYETRVGERGVKLSGGERQRVSIARAAIKQPSVYVFDEATSSLDTRSEREILSNLRQISRHGTTLVIAHRLSTVIHADEIAVLEGGTIVERGTHTTLLLQDGLYAALWKAQQGGAVAA